MPENQTVIVTQKNGGCLSGCGSLFAVLVVIGLAIEYWYIAIAVAAVAACVGVWYWRRQPQVAAAPATTAVAASPALTSASGNVMASEQPCTICSSPVSGNFCAEMRHSADPLVCALRATRADQPVLPRVRLRHLPATYAVTSEERMKLALSAVIATAALFSTLAAGCGGASGPVPDVVGDRLDVAKSEMDGAGYDTEEIGGGTFGIVVESNWVVCETDPAAGATGGGKVQLIVDRSCESAKAEPASSTEDADLAADEQPEAEEQPVEETAVAQPAARRVRVPNVVGMDHQAAQNRMQAVGLFNLRERDAGGQGRLLIWDRNWVVVDQQPASGARVGENRKIVLFSVKDGER